MEIELNNNKTKMDYKELMYVNSYVGKVFKAFFKLKGYEADCDFAKKNGFAFYYSYHSNGFSLQTNEFAEKRFIYPMRYYDYPNIDDEYDSVTWVPNQVWLLGFIERIFITLDRILLEIIDERGKEYLNLVQDSKNKFEKNMLKPIKPNEWRSEIRRIEENNAQKKMIPKYLSFDRSKPKELKEDIQKLLFDEHRITIE